MVRNYFHFLDPLPIIHPKSQLAMVFDDWERPINHPRSQLPMVFDHRERPINHSKSQLAMVVDDRKRRFRSSKTIANWDFGWIIVWGTKK